MPNVSTDYMVEYARTSCDSETACTALIGALTGHPVHDWLQCAQALVLRHDIQTATRVLSAAMTEYPDSGEVNFALAGMHHQLGRYDQAEILLRNLLERQPCHEAATFLLVRIFKDHGRMCAAATAIRQLFQHGQHELATVIQAVELLDECDRKQDAAAICEAEIAGGSTDPRIYAYAGMLLAQLGQFDLARKRYIFALANSEHAFVWNIALGLAGLQRYKDASHPDFTVFQDNLRRSDLNDQERASLLFALGKAHDDIGDYANAAQYLRQGNALQCSHLRWSRKLWRRGVEARRGRKRLLSRSAKLHDWTPVFIVGMPRSGTTLLAELLARHPDVCNRGELAWMQKIEQQFSPDDRNNPAWYEDAAAIYQSQLRQDDSDALWFIDKQPHNFLCVDLILALFPYAKIIYCCRHARDNALSLWSQCFVADAQGFSYDFADIAAVIQSSQRLMAHWQTDYASSIQVVHYEQLTSNPATCIAALATWLGLPECDLLATESRTTAISTASLWQARQPVYTRSVERWSHYAPFLPELLRFPASL